MNMLRTTVIVVVLSLICYVAVSQEVTGDEENEDSGLMTDDETVLVDNVDHERYKRARRKGKKGKKGKGTKTTADLSGLIQVEDCPAGTRLPRNCEPCPVGFYSAKEGLWKDCLPCKDGETTLPDDGTKCVEKCSAGMTWNHGKQTDCKRPVYKKRARCKNCIKCEDNMYKADAGNEPCLECPEYFMSNKDSTDCVIKCPAGYEPRDLPDGNRTCFPCLFGYYKIKSGGDSDMCLQCKGGKMTLETGATKEKDCIRNSFDAACSKVLTLVNQHLQMVAIKRPTVDDVISTACEMHELKMLDICDVVDALYDCATSMEGHSSLVYRDGTTTLSLKDLLNADVPCIRWVDEVYGPTTMSYSYSSGSSGMWYWPGMWSSGGGESSGDGNVWGAKANWLGDEGHGTFDLSDLLSKWKDKRDVHKRSLSGSGGPTGKVCKPKKDWSDIPPAAEYENGSFMMQKKIDGGKPKGDGTKS